MSNPIFRVKVLHGCIPCPECNEDVRMQSNNREICLGCRHDFTAPGPPPRVALDLVPLFSVEDREYLRLWNISLAEDVR